MATHPQSPFLAFVRDERDIETLKQFSEAHGWPDTGIVSGDISAATQFLKEHGSPSLLLVEVPSASEAPSLMDKLAEACSPDTKVIVTGGINEYSFYCWLMDLGISSYLLKPLNVQALESAYAKANEQVGGGGKQEKTPATVIALMGTRGGVGTTSLAISLAGIIGDVAKKNVALVDIDPQEGSVALSLDLEPSRGFREALEKPDRVDALFIERVMSKLNKHLSILSSEESLQDYLSVHEHAGDALLKEMKDKFDVVVLDIPRYLNNFSRKCLVQADHVILVTELTLLSLRDTLRLADLMRESLKMKQPVVVANKVGLSAKNEVKVADFEKGINAKVAYTVGFVPDLFMQVGADIPAVKHKNNAALKPLFKLAEQLVPEAKMQQPEAKEKKKSGGLFARKGKDTKE